MANTIDPSLYLSNKQTNQKQTGQNVLGKDDFMKILMTQLQNQDPLKPMEDKEFISQMATFSSLEQMTNMNQMLGNFVNSQASNSIMMYSEMIGKEVEWSRTDTETGEETSGTGVVTSVLQQGRQFFLELENGERIAASTVSRISRAES